MLHVLNRLYVELDTQLIYVYPYYIASPNITQETFVQKGGKKHPPCLGMFDNGEVVTSDLLLLSLDENITTNEKRVIFTDIRNYFEVLKTLVVSSIDNATLEDVRKIAFFDTIRNSISGMNSLSQLEFTEITEKIDLDVNDELVKLLRKNSQYLSFEYKLYDKVIKGSSKYDDELIDKIKYFVARSAENTFIEIRRNIHNSFFNEGNNLSSDATKHRMVGNINFMSGLLDIKYLNKKDASIDFLSYTDEILDDVLNDISVFYKEHPAGCEDVVDIEKTKIIMSSGRLSDDEIIPSFLNMLRMNSLYHDVLDWNDGDMINIPLLFYIANSKIH